MASDMNTKRKTRRLFRASFGFVLLLPFAIVTPLLTDASYAQVGVWLRDQFKAIYEGVFAVNS